jgi:endoglucanase
LGTLLFLIGLLWLPSPILAQTKWRGMMVSPDVTEKDLNDLGKWKVNLIRWQLTLLDKTVVVNPTGYDQWLETKLQQVDRLLPVCERNGLKVVLDLHTPPGGRDESSVDRVFLEKQYQTQFLNVWERIAKRYKNNTVIWAYDLLNEPGYRSTAKGLLTWQELAQKTARLIRTIDSRHKIIVEAAYGSPTKMSALRPLSGVSGVVYSVHVYAPMSFTHQGIRDRPAGIQYPANGWDQDRLEKHLKEVRDFQKQYDVPIYVGEFSAVRWAPGDSGYQYLRDLIGLFDDYCWDWTYHAFRECDCWSVEHGSDPNNHQPSSTPTKRQTLLQRWFARNK